VRDYSWECAFCGEVLRGIGEASLLLVVQDHNRHKHDRSFCPPSTEALRLSPQYRGERPSTEFPRLTVYDLRLLKGMKVIW